MRFAVFAAAFFAAAPAAAAPGWLVQCDGYNRRISDAESFGRGLLTLGTLGIIGSQEANKPTGFETGEKGVEACTRALESKELTGNPIRRSEVLAARALHNLGLGRADAALADADAAAAVPMPPQAQVAFDRTLKPSLQIVRAQALVALGRQADAETAALEAIRLRPWASFNLERAGAILGLTPTISPDEQAALDRAARASLPGLRQRADRLSAAGDHAGAARDMAALIAAIEVNNPEPETTLYARLAAERALAGDSAAKAAVDAAQAKVDALAPIAQGTDDKAQKAAQQVARSDEMIALARAELARREGRTAEAQALLSGRTRWLAPASVTADVIAAANKAYGPAWRAPVDPDKLIADDLRVRREKLSAKEETRLAVVMLPRFEPMDTFTDLGGYLARGEGVKAEPKQDGKVLRLSFSRKAAGLNTLEEWMLLASARQARQQGADRFAVVSAGALPQLGREGVTALVAVSNIALPAGAMLPVYKAQQDRSLSVDEIEAALARLPRRSREIARLSRGGASGPARRGRSAQARTLLAREPAARRRCRARSCLPQPCRFA
jgi:hypothetical protein